MSEQNDTSDEKKRQADEKKQQDEFIRIVNELLKPYMKKLGWSYHSNTVAQVGQSVLAPLMGLSFFGLGGYLGAQFFGSYLRERNKATDSAVETEVGHKISKHLVREVFKLPEVEIDTHNNTFFSERINQIAKTAIAYAESKVQHKTGILMSVLALLTTGFTAAPVLVMMPIVVVTSFFSSRWIGKHEREVLRPHMSQFIEASSQTREKQDALLKNIPMTKSTGSEEQLLEGLENSQANTVTKKEGWKNVVVKCLNKVTAVNVILTVLMVVAAITLGLGVTGVAGAFVGTAMLSGGVSSSVRAYYRARQHEDGLRDQFKTIQHKKVFDLNFGQERVQSNESGQKNNESGQKNNNSEQKNNNEARILLSNICYHHRDRETGERLSHPVIFAKGEFEIGPGITVLGGMSGAGKSTLYKLLRHADDLSSGSISIGVKNNEGVFEDKKLTDLAKGEEFKNIAFCLQNIEDDGRTALDIIKSGNPSKSDTEIDNLINKLDLELYTESDGVKVPKKLSNLSGGEKKCVLFLQTLISDKPILVFDEPTSGVDTTRANKMLSMLNEKKDNRTIIFTTHTPSELTHLDAHQALDLVEMHDEAQIKAFREKFGNDVRLPSVIEWHDISNEADKNKYIELVRSRGTSQSEQETNNNDAREQFRSSAEILLATSADFLTEQEKKALKDIINKCPSPAVDAQPANGENATNADNLVRLRSSVERLTEQQRNVLKDIIQNGFSPAVDAQPANEENATNATAEKQSVSEQETNEEVTNLGQENATKATAKHENNNDTLVKCYFVAELTRAEQENATNATEEKKSATEQNQAEASKQKQRPSLWQRLFSKNTRT